jgi:hypothetical protein
MTSTATDRPTDRPTSPTVKSHQVARLLVTNMTVWRRDAPQRLPNPNCCAAAGWNDLKTQLKEAGNNIGFGFSFERETLIYPRVI